MKSMKDKYLTDKGPRYSTRIFNRKHDMGIEEGRLSFQYHISLQSSRGTSGKEINTDSVEALYWHFVADYFQGIGVTRRWMQKVPADASGYKRL